MGDISSLDSLISFEVFELKKQHKRPKRLLFNLFFSSDYFSGRFFYVPILDLDHLNQHLLSQTFMSSLAVILMITAIIYLKPQLIEDLQKYKD